MRPSVLYELLDAGMAIETRIGRTVTVLVSLIRNPEDLSMLNADRVMVDRFSRRMYG
jgi:hypothetical protein